MRRMLPIFGVVFLSSAVLAQVAIRGETVYTMAGDAITDGVVVIEGGKIKAVGPATTVQVPEGYREITGKVVTPGLIDAHTVVGFSGYLNQDHDQDQLEKSAPIQPELRAIDGYNAREVLVDWVRQHGVTTIHTGHGPGALISGQTMVAKTRGVSVDEAVIVPQAMLAATLSNSARASGGKSPGTKAKMVALLRKDFIKAQGYLKKQENEEKQPSRDLKMEVLAKVLKGELPLLVTVHRANDILTTLRLAKEFTIKVVLDGAAEAYLVKEQILEAGVPVLVHPTMSRTFGERENLTMEAGSILKEAKIPFAFQSGFEAYVPKTRVVLFEAAIAAAHGLSFRDTLAAVTIDAARILGLEARIGSLEVGKDGDIAVFNGDPFEYTTHVTHVIVEGEVVSDKPR